VPNIGQPSNSGQVSEVLFYYLVITDISIETHDNTRWQQLKTLYFPEIG